jgi:hypothetical protein
MKKPMVRKFFCHITDVGMMKLPSAGFSTFNPEDEYERKLSEEKGMDYNLYFISKLIKKRGLDSRKLIFFEEFDMELPIDECHNYSKPTCAREGCNDQKEFMYSCFSCGKSLCLSHGIKHPSNGGDNICPLCGKQFHEGYPIKAKEE